MSRILLATLLAVATFTFSPAGASAQDAPGGANLMKLPEGAVGNDSLRIQVLHDPTVYAPGSWEVIGETPGVADSAAPLECDWTVTGEPGETAGLFFCDLFDLAEGNHFLTLQAVNANRTDTDPNTYLWHTVGPATGIVSTDLPGAFSTAGSAGGWDAGPAAATVKSPQVLNLSWQPYTASAKDFPAVGYLIEVDTGGSISRFVADRTDIDLFLTPQALGESDLAIYPVTARGLINEAFPLSVTVPNTVRSYTNAVTVNQIVGAADYDTAADPQILRYYVAFFDRQPDLGGAKYWLGIRRAGYSPGQIAGFMAGSNEFAENYEGTSDREYLTSIYRNVLGRQFDQAGFDYWLDTLQGTNLTGKNPDGAQISRSAVVFYVAQSVEFQTNNPFLP